MDNNKIQVLFTGAFRFPDGDAAALRVYSIAKLFEMQHCKIHFSGWEQRIEQKEYIFDGFNCHSQCELDVKYKNPIKRLVNFIFRGFKTLKWIINHNKFDIIVIYNPPSFFALGMIFLSYFYGFKLILDSTEWYESTHLIGGKYGIASLENCFRMKFVYKYFKNNIYISSYLENYYPKTNTIIIAPLLIDNYGEIQNDINQYINFIYAGQLGKKDLILPFIKILPIIASVTNRDVKFNLIGLSVYEVKNIFRINNIEWSSYAQYLECHGVVNRETVLQLYSRSHFSILFREDKQYAHAGFPTKAVESLSQSCPVITNAIGDLRRYLDESNSIIVDSELNNLAKLIKYVIESNKYDLMRSNAYKTFQNNFTLMSKSGTFKLFYERMMNE